MSKSILGWQQDTEKIVTLTYRVGRELWRADGEESDRAGRVSFRLNTGHEPTVAVGQPPNLGSSTLELSVQIIIPTSRSFAIIPERQCVKPTQCPGQGRCHCEQHTAFAIR